jgi:hypothetical protein
MLNHSNDASRCSAQLEEEGVALLVSQCISDGRSRQFFDWEEVMQDGRIAWAKTQWVVAQRRRPLFRHVEVDKWHTAPPPRAFHSIYGAYLLYSFDKGLGGSGPARWIRPLLKETGNPTADLPLRGYPKRGCETGSGDV